MLPRLSVSVRVPAEKAVVVSLHMAWLRLERIARGAMLPPTRQRREVRHPGGGGGTLRNTAIAAARRCARIVERSTACACP
ncbi:hypothetical protein GCM10011504_13780 [Siccirubricoccus deserti]|nr:hypothetical protein GCM10011504_13780 [Siccirubricoccus deserti]